MNDCTLRIQTEQAFDLRMDLKVAPSTVYDHYGGPYVVIPEVYEQELETKDKLMDDDVSVLEIPYSETSNPHGTTVIIATH